MKTLKIILICALFFGINKTHAQFLDNLGKVAERAVQRTVEHRVDREVSKSTDRTLDTLIEAPKKSKKEQRRENKKRKKDGNIIGETSNTSIANSGEENPNNQINSNFDFQAGTVEIFADNFNRDNVGDFPAKWDTNGSGEIVTINGEKWFNIAVDSKTHPLNVQALPENYTIEFDLLTEQLTKDNVNVSSGLYLYFESEPKFKKGSTYAFTNISFMQYGGGSWTNTVKYVNGKEELKNNIRTDYKNAINGKSRISISVNGPRLRMWINEDKIVDVPRLVPDGKLYFKMELKHINTSYKNNRIFIDNFRLAKAGQDNRSKLLTEGKLSTNAILFNTGSAKIKSGSEAILKEVAEAMQSVPAMRIMIVGHTDADGDENSNLKLSEERAKSVRAALVSQYGISMGRIQTDGKGESNPVSDNSSENGKSQNRRVEFIKL